MNYLPSIPPRSRRDLVPIQGLPFLMSWFYHRFLSDTGKSLYHVHALSLQFVPSSARCTHHAPSIASSPTPPPTKGLLLVSVSANVQLTSVLGEWPGQT